MGSQQRIYFTLAPYENIRSTNNTTDKTSLNTNFAYQFGELDDFHSFREYYYKLLFKQVMRFIILLKLEMEMRAGQVNLENSHIL